MSLQTLEDALEIFEDISDRNERSEMLLYYADQYKEIPKEIASKPYSDDYKVPYCESQAYVWGTNPKDDILQFYFAIENPQGISAKALASLLTKYVSGKPASEIALISPDIVFKIFGENLGMVRAEGLRGMVKMVRAYALRYLRAKE